MRMTIAEIAKAIDADTTYVSDKQAQIEITNVNFDSRNITQDGLFIPLKGEHDGHNYINSAAANGAAAALFARDHLEELPVSIPVLIVDDPLTSFQALSRYYLDKINPRVVAITGSNGKTTTKDMVAAVLSKNFNVVKTHDNFNNEIGVPYTVLQMESNTEFLVVELGMDRPGQLDFLSRLVSPDVAVITMIGEAHIEFFKTRDKIADAKMEITHGLKEDGFFIYNGDEPLLNERAESLDFQKMTFGTDKHNNLYPTEIIDCKYETKFKANISEDIEYTIPVIGEYNVTNALAALAVGKVFRIRPEVAVNCLKELDLTKNRTEWLNGKNDVAILSDVYNSNPTAAKKVLAVFSGTEVAGKKIVVLGDMLELGTDSPAMHASLASELNPSKINDVFLVGSDIKALYDKLAPEYGDHVRLFSKDSLDQVTSELQSLAKPGDAIMLKASHGIHLENIVSQLV
ncbi:UDP-N-acetylmuramoyl-tripeptide--D-alanyl-D-alanine ligase [Lentilactobacillus sp. Marseille-Q4993]|uniref:UDP-N-acetylmuramoyl-tripeptide--D-alanyl-D- alanine ligase n=1 Tax=Lentilactobacillus sp. Marseille-Q4993 TaxID=3039492 RepID=UPI0024BD0888|nr:UDP-N-acetylmuramoyl-tripeptide--D-alanyl-D-alanine ligase [Lentilactobacillus sp. Marseille-Q4993]